MIRPPSTRISLAVLMALIGALALELAAMRDASPFATVAAFNLTLFVLLVGLLGTLVRRGEAGWTGFALFGWSFALFTFAPAFQQATPGLMTNPWLNDLAWTLHPLPGPPPSPPALNATFMRRIGDPSNLMNHRKGMMTRQGLTPADETLLDDYIDQQDTYQALVATANERNSRAVQVGQSLFILVFAVIGAILGRLLAAKRPPDEARVC